MIIKRGFKFKLKATAEQENLFRQFAGACRWVFNRGLDQRQKAFTITGKSPSYFEQSYPKFKKKGNKESFRFPQGVRIEGAQVFLPKIGWIKFHKSREIIGTIKETTMLHTRIKNLRHEFVQQLSTKMIKNHDIFCVESLDISHLLKISSRAQSRAISDVGWRSFLHCLKYKAEEKGKYLIEAGKYFPSSQICSCCDNQQPMPLHIRKYECVNCGVKNDRDYNSAIVLKAAGMSVLIARGAALSKGSVEAGIFCL